MKILIILATVLLATTLNAQELNGIYVEGTDTITFNDNRVHFKVNGNDGLGIVFAGEGKYEIMDDFIIISTEDFSGAKTKVKTNPAAKKDTIQIQFFNQDGYTIKGVRAEFLNKKENPIGLSVSNEQGIVLYRTNPKVTAIKAADLLYDKAIFDCEAGNDYEVHLVKSRVLENKTVIFKLVNKTEDKLTMKLLSTDFNKKDPSVSQMKKLDKKTAAIIDRSRSFVKPEPELQMFR